MSLQICNLGAFGLKKADGPKEQPSFLLVGPVPWFGDNHLIGAKSK